jgi:hypothetical protein
MQYTLEQLKELSLETLKSMAYDNFAVLEATQTNLKTLNQIIAEKSQPAPEVKGEVVDETK